MGFVCTTMRPAVGEELDAVVAEGSGGELDVAEVAAEDLRGRRRRHGEHVHRHGRRGQRRQQPQLQRRRRRHAQRPRFRDDIAIAAPAPESSASSRPSASPLGPAACSPARRRLMDGFVDGRGLREPVIYSQVPRSAAARQELPHLSGMLVYLACDKL